MNLKQTIKEAHETALINGFWDDYKEIEKQYHFAKSFDHLHYMLEFWEKMKLNWTAAQLALIHSEASELEEAESEENFNEELADICIRVFDLIGGLEIDMDVAIDTIVVFGVKFVRSDRSINWYISQALEHLRKEQYYPFAQSLMDIFSRCWLMAEGYGVDLDEAIEKKMEYNKTRPYKHGKRL